ncbi:hypothetical protein DR864_11875 [Runella rosea]|uniref:ELWxxDGT repeat-containing protein n=1 Tax=Runella rosea TaxID=2259595 RepID=A0A344TIC6_9BACT|nr:ELWxxDGT repeat protein [Runella rosea]AXE18397.1 hypothetical protein DR864_11875 [Runella rosea]
MKSLLLVVSFFTFCSSLQAQSLLKDIKTDNGSSHPRQVIDINGTIFFLTKTNSNETVELWKSDGTNAGTSLVKNPYAGAAGPFFPNTSTSVFFKFNDKLIFTATDTQSNQTLELWITDGTAAGTKMLKDINPGNSGSNPNTFVQLGAKFLFKAFAPTSGEELWVSDGTTDGTQLCKDIYSGNNPSSIRGFTVFNEKAFFYASEPNTGTELWMTDGTTAGTAVVTDAQLNPGGGLSTIDATIQLPVATSTHLYFPVANSVYGKALFGYSTTGLLGLAFQNGYGNAIPKELTLFNDRVYFTANFNNIATQRNLFKTDPNDYAQYALGAYGNDPKDLTVANGKLFFTADDFNLRRELFKTDGITDITAPTPIKDINPTTTTGDVTFPTEAAKRIFIGTPTRLYFFANNGTTGFELWSSDGTSSGTNLVKDFITGTGTANYSYLQAFESELFFIANETSLGYKAWKTNGTLAGTQTVESITPALNITNVYPLRNSGSTFFLSAFSATTGYELYKLSGGVVSLVKDIKTVSQNNNQNFSKVNEGMAGIFFIYDNGKDGMELWKTDGTQSGTQLFYDFYSYPLSTQNPYRSFTSFDFYSNSSMFNSEFVWYNNKMYFFVNQQLWVTDGTNPPTLFKNTQGNGSNNAYSLAVYQGALYFNIDNNLWKTDGTEAGTVLVKSLDNSQGPPLSNFAVVNNLLFFSGYTSTHGEEIWRSDGTTAGTFMTKELIPGINYPELPSSFKVKPMGNTLFFTFYDSVIGRELWKSDGTEAGTVLVKDIASGEGVGSSPEYMTNFNNQYLVFSGNNSDWTNPNANGNGTELWKSDGTTAGTQMIKDLNPALGESSYPINLYQNSFAIFNNKIYFSSTAPDGQRRLTVSDLTPTGTYHLDMLAGVEVRATHYGLAFVGYDTISISNEPYFSDGTTKVLLKNIAPATNFSSSPNSFYHSPLRKIILFLANDGTTGPEIHALKDCPIQSTVGGTLSGTNQITAHQFITSTAKLSTNSTTTFTAGNAILLAPGFETTAVKSFLTQINGCTYSTTGPAPVPGN